MAGKRKCKICGKWIEDNDDSVKYKNGYAHTECFNIAMKVTITNKQETLQSKKKTVSKKPQKELKDGLSEEEFREKKNLCDYIRHLIKEDISVATYKLIEDYKKKYRISYKEMYDDLYWYFELCGHGVEGDRVIAIVPLCHTEAQKYYTSVKNANESCRKCLDELPNMYKETTAAVSERRSKNIPEIDIGAIGGD